VKLPHLPGFMHIPGGAAAGGGGLLALVVILGVLASQAKTPAEKEQLNKAIERFFGNIASGIGHYFSGQELFGPPRSEAEWWRSGAPLPDDRNTETPIAELGREPAPAAPAGVSFDKPAPKSGTARVGRAVVTPVRLLWGTLAAVGRTIRAWHRWPYSARAAVRVAPIPVLWGLWRYPVETELALGCAVLVALAAALTGRSVLNLWRVQPGWNYREVYAPGLWVVFRQALRLDPKEKRRRHLDVPDDMHAEGARIVLRLPVSWVSTPEAMKLIEDTVEQRAPGEWVPRWGRTGQEHFVEWTVKPKPKVRPKLPQFVQWQPTGDARRVFVGMAVDGFDLIEAYVQTQTATPHWGVAGDTGSGKSTVLYIPVVHGRMTGELIDILDTKRNSLIEAEGFSGVRVHKSVRECISAFAEFLASMMAAEAAAGKGADPQLKSMLVSRTLVIDELPTLIKLAYTWWRYGLKGKGTPPFLDWLGIILLQGRSSNHRVVVGTQQFANSYFGGTMERAQIGTRIAVGQQDRTSWGVAFGQNTPVLGFDTDIPGRGAYSDKRKDPEADYLYVREIQPCYITPDVAGYLAKCAPAPAWFDAGEIAPWITADILAEVAEIAATTDFLPGGKHAPKSLPAAAVPPPRAVTVGPPSSQAPTTPVVTGAGGADVEDQEEELPDTYSLSDAFDRGILPWKAGTVRTYFKRGEKRGIAVPEGISDGSTSFYSEAELVQWLDAWRAWQEKNGTGPTDAAPKEEAPSV